MKKEKDLPVFDNFFNLSDEYIRGYLKNLAQYDDTITREDFFKILKILGIHHYQTAILAAMGKNYNSFDLLKKRVKKGQEASTNGKLKDDDALDASEQLSSTSQITEDIRLDIGEAFSFKNILRGLAMESLRSAIQKHLLKAFELVPSEVICIWIYSKRRIPYEIINTKDTFVQECVLIDGTMLNFDEISTKPIFVSYRDDIRKFHKHQPSLISFPLSKNTIIRRTGENIKKHPFKRFKEHRSADYLKKGCMHSLMRIPVVTHDYIIDINENRPYFFISFENKLNDTRSRILEISNNSTNEEFFTEDDEKNALSLREELFLEIYPWLIIAFHDDVPMKRYIDLFDKDRKPIHPEKPSDIIIPPYPDNI